MAQGTCLFCNKIYFRERKDRVGKYCNRTCVMKKFRYIESEFWTIATNEQKIERLKNNFEKHVIRKENECWGWKGCLSSGYGTLTFGKDKLIKSHRASWLIHHGEIPEGLIVRHTCDNPSCTNPDHLLLGTHKDNADDKYSRNRDRHVRGDSHPSRKITSEDVIQIRQLLKEDIKVKNIAKEFNISPNIVYSISYNRTWRSI